MDSILFKEHNALNAERSLIYTEEKIKHSLFQKLQMVISLENENFGKAFWYERLTELGYPVKETEIPVNFLRERKAIPPGTNLKRGLLYYSDPLTFDLILLEFDKLPPRTAASRISRYWKSHQQGRQLIIFEDGHDSYAIVIPGAYEEGTSKARILGLSDTIYHTDAEALNSLRFVSDKKAMREAYDNHFLPYEKVREEFFLEYRNMYQEIYGITKDILGPNASSYSQRFLGRLMFLYFLQKKGWLKGDKKFVNTIKDYGELNWTFYEALSKEGNNGFPYLDGTLFEREEYFSQSIEKSLLDSMNNAFYKAREFLNKYNFTVDELSPNDLEVSVDPAMIGTIFENMLPENERGSKGTFYTPLEEISFICRRALSNYLGIPERVIIVDGKQKLEDGVENLIRSFEEKKNEKEVLELRRKLLDIRILDPAVGSGGFLLGMMHEIVGILKRIDESAGWEPRVDHYKDKILQNLFGFDIEGEAIEIARLRLWLSMIVDKKDPEVLRSLDMNLVTIGDSLVKPQGVQAKLGDESLDIFDRMSFIRGNFINATSFSERAKLRKELANIQDELEKKTGIKGGMIESWLPEKADIIIMNPPYVRQESIPAEKKKYYTSTYKIDRKSDLYAYFILRAVQLIRSDGIVSTICSDKWLETDYGLDIQKWISTRLIAVYGQRERTFGADINSIIFVYGNKTDSFASTDFTYLETYPSRLIRNHTQFKRVEMKPGKWFYLRAPRLFMEKIYPKLTHKLGDFADIKFGIKTGANEFFYMRDVSLQYGTDYLANPKKFEDWGVSARNEKELKEQSLIYIENEGGERFVIDISDAKPLVRTTKDLRGYKIDKVERLCLYTKTPGVMTQKYIEWGRNQSASIRGQKDPVIGYNNRPSVSGRKKWYSLNDLEPANIILPMYVMDRFFIPSSDEPVICDHTLYTIKSNTKGIVAYLNSTIFYITMELYLRRLGGGVGEIMVDDYEQMPVPDLRKLNLTSINVSLNRDVKRYFEEVRADDRKDLDSELMNLLGIDDLPLDQFYNEFVGLVGDRILKAGRSLKPKEDVDEQNN
ncbi:Type I restriction-modification system methyltransferase subunit [Thermoplasmatales archaeon]|nr:Type I restriction-modification system methyltransferase subunit [Thermoplasmatales archaeon]